MNMAPIVSGIVQAQPDYYYGMQPTQVHGTVRSDLSKHVIPSSHAHLLAVPNFSMEVKGPGRSSVEGVLQACHNGGIGARAMHSLQTISQQDPAYDNYIRTISLLYHGGTLKMYGHSVAQPGGPGTRPEYYMHQIKTWVMTSDQEPFLRGATAYKNAMDMTAEYRKAAIEHANSVASRAAEDSNTLPNFTMDSATSTLDTEGVDSEEEEDEDDADDEDEDENEDESETSVEGEYRPPPSKRSSGKSHRSRHRAHQSRRLGSSRSDAPQTKSTEKSRSFWPW